MKTESQTKLSAFKESVQTLYGVSDASETFNVSPAASQTLIDDVKETDDFLTHINIVTVDNLIGEAIGLGVGRMIASRTDTSGGNERKTRSVYDLTPMPYECTQTNFDTHITYNQLDAFAHLKNFEERVNNQIRIGEDGDFVNLDLAVLTIKNLLDHVFASTNDLIAIVGNELVASDQARLYAQNGNTPSEKAKIEMRQVISTYGGLPTYTVSNFPPRGIMVTSFDNLSIYILNNSIRKSVGVKNDKKDRIENFECMSMAYLVEQLGKAATLEFDNVKLKKSGSDVWE